MPQSNANTTHLVALIAACIVANGCGGPPRYDTDFEIPRTERFAASLSEYGLYEEPLAALRPTARAKPYELSSALFTDYAFKQRLVMVPEGSSVTRVDDATLAYPEGTILVKTFYYPTDMRDAASALQIIETRLLIKTANTWNVATYLWNTEQTDATLLLEGTTTQMSWIDETGQTRSTEYAVPHEGECVTCHQSDGTSGFIGPTLRNLNRAVTRGGAETNQLAYLRTEGVLDAVDAPSAPTIPNYESDDPLENRARAYLDSNCAHCHNPAGWGEAADQNLDFRYETPLDQTGLERRGNDVVRQLEDGNMPYLGTTLLHDEGIRLVADFVDSL